MFKHLLSSATTFIFGVLLTLVLIWYIPTAEAAPSAYVTTAQAPTIVQESVAAAPMISYQGRLLDPVTGQPKPDGSYTMAFRLYAVNSGGSALWTENKSITVNKGLFSTLLGDTTALDLAIFNGQDLFLGITVGADPETAPRQQLAHVAYAIYAATAGKANNADRLENNSAAAFAPAGHTHDGSTIVDESITASDIKNRTRTISYPANALSYTSGDAVIKQSATGLDWAASFSSPAYLWITKPSDWDGSSDVVLRIYFQVTSNNGGSAGFFIRPRSYNVGNVFADAASQNADGSSVVTVSANGNRTIYSQTFTMPANKFARDNWVVTLQRLGAGTETYGDSVILHTVEISYTAVQ